MGPGARAWFAGPVGPGELLTNAADAARSSGRIKRALVLLTEALDQLDPATDPARVALLLMRLGHARWGTGDEPACLVLQP